MKKTLLMIFMIVAAASSFAGEKLICVDGIGSKVEVKYYDDYHISPYGEKLLSLTFTITGPATQTLSWWQGYEPEPIVRAGGLLREDGVLEISFRHAKSKRYYNAYIKYSNQLHVYPGYGNQDHPAWVFQNCHVE